MDKTLDKNIRMFFNVARNADKVEKIISLGSGAEYDIRFYKPNMKEDYFDVHVPIDDYGFSKYICSKYILSRSGNITCLRLFGVFGKYEKYYLKFISNAIVKNLLDMPITIVQNTNFDFLYIDDLVRIIEYFLTHDIPASDYNVTNGCPTDLVALARKVNAVARKKSEILILKEGLGKEYTGDNSKLLKAIPGFTFTSIDDAIGSLYEWYAANPKIIDMEKIKEGDRYLAYSRIGKL